MDPIDIGRQSHVSLIISSLQGRLRQEKSFGSERRRAQLARNRYSNTGTRTVKCAYICFDWLARPAVSGLRSSSEIGKQQTAGKVQ
jgi:hypothetical protein